MRNNERRPHMRISIAAKSTRISPSPSNGALPSPYNTIGHRVSCDTSTDPSVNQSCEVSDTSLRAFCMASAGSEQSPKAGLASIMSLKVTTPSRE